MTHPVYLVAIAFSAVGVLLLARRAKLPLPAGRLLSAVAVTVPVFLALDAAGAFRGWFKSDPRLSLAILPGGVSIEEPFLLSFLVLVSITLWLGATRVSGRGRG